MFHNKKSNSLEQWNQKIWLNAETKLIMLPQSKWNILILITNVTNAQCNLYCKVARFNNFLRPGQCSLYLTVVDKKKTKR